MASYNGIFERSATGQINDIPRTGSLDTSPDIIPYGIIPVGDPAAFFSANYGEDPSKALEANMMNYIYLRGKNYSGDRIDDSGDSRPRLFWSKASLLLFPQTWNELTRSPSGKPYTLAANAGEVGVADEPFIWKPEDISNDHYCLIAQVPSPGYDNSIPPQITDFNSWVANHGGIAWRSVSINNSKSIIITGSMDYQQGPDGSLTEFVLVCKSLPAGTKVSFSAGVPGPSPVIYLAPTEVMGDAFVVGLQSIVPANYVSTIYYNVELPYGTPPSNASVSLMIWYTADKGSGLQKVWMAGENSFHLA